MKLKLLSLLFLTSLFSFGQNSNIPTSVPTYGLLAYYPFNGNANDISINASNGVVAEAIPSQDRFGNSNSAYFFNGTNSNIEADVKSYPLKGESRTITGWFKATAPIVSEEFNFCLLNYGNISDPNYWFKISFYRKGYLDLQFDAKTVQSQANYFNNKWTFFAMTFDDATNKYVLYIDNVYVNGGTADLYTNGVGNLFRIGRNKLNNYFEGSIDDIGIWNRVLTQEEISGLYGSYINPYTLIPDVNFEKKLIVLGIDSGTPDGKVLTANISSLTSLNVSSSSITDLTGIQDFLSLTNLNCYNNKLTNIDVTKNIALTTLDCGLNKLSSVDFSKNTALTYLNCTNMQQLTTLDVSKNVALVTLYCYNNRLTALDISKNVSLVTLQCSTNLISALDLSKNVALKTLTCTSNQLSTLDVSKNGSLTGLNCSSNQLVNLDLRNGKNTILLNDKSSNFTNNPNLTCIQVDNVAYSNTNWATLKDAIASYNTSCTPQYTLIPDVNFENKLIELAIDTDGKNGYVLTSSINTIQSLDVSSSFITDLTGIQDFSALRFLECNSNELTSLDVSKNTALIHLYCSKNRLTTLDVSKNTALTVLHCYDNQLTNLDVSQSTALDHLYCYLNRLATLDVSKNTVLTKLDCHNNQLTTIDVSKNTALTDFYCYNNQLTSLDVSNIIPLKYLECYENKLTTLDVSKNLALKQLHCYSNQLTSLDVTSNTALQILYCYSNQLPTIEVSKKFGFKRITLL